MSKAYQKKVKDITENFVQNAQSVQGMIDDMEAEIFTLLKKKEKIREKLVELREDKKLHPTARERGAVLLDDVADFANLYNLRQPAYSRVDGVDPHKGAGSNRPVLGEGPKLTRHMIMEMNPAQVVFPVTMTPSSSPTTLPVASPSGTPPASFSTPQSPPQKPAGHTKQVSDVSSLSVGNAPVDQPSVATSFTVAFSPLTAPPDPKDLEASTTTSSAAAAKKPSSGAAPAAAASSSSSSSSSPATAAAAAAAASSQPQLTPEQKAQQDVYLLKKLNVEELPVLALKFRLMLPPNTSMESIRQKLQDKVDAHVSEIRESIDNAQTALEQAVDEAEDEAKKAGELDEGSEGEEAKKEDDPKIADLTDLFWKSLKIVVGVQRGPVAYQASIALVTVYVYRFLSQEQKLRQEKLEQLAEAKLNDAAKQAHVDDDLKEVQEEFNSRGARQLRAVARLLADCGFSFSTEVQVTAQKSAAQAAKDAASAAAEQQQRQQQQQGDNANNNNNNRASSGSVSNNLNNNTAEDILQRVLETAPRVEASVREALEEISKAAQTSQDDVSAIAAMHAEHFYKDSLLPAVQRNADPDDAIVKVINELVDDPKKKFKPRACPPPSAAAVGFPPVTPPSSTSPTTTSNNLLEGDVDDGDDDKKAVVVEEEEEEPPYTVCINGHHAELNHLPKYFVRQTANTIYDYALDKTESLAGRAYIAMCRRRTLAGVALYDALHFNVVPLPRDSEKERAKSACAFYHAERLMHAAVMSMAVRTVEHVIDARARLAKVIEARGYKDESGGGAAGAGGGAGGGGGGGAIDSSKQGVISRTLSTLKLAMRIGKRLFNKFREERARDVENAAEGERTNAFAFVNGQVCCCDSARAIEVDVYMPDSNAICTVKIVMRPATPEFLSPRIRPRRADAKNPLIQAATMHASTCRGRCTTVIPEYGLEVGEAFVDMWLKQLQEVIAESKEGEDKKQE